MWYVKQENQSITIHEDPVVIFDALKAIADASDESAASSEVSLLVNIAKLIQSKCVELQLGTSKCVGQGFDGAHVSAAKELGLQQSSKKSLPP